MKNIIVVGDKYSGKSSFVRRLTTGDFSSSYIHSLTTCYEKYLNTHIFDSVDSDKFTAVNDEYYKIADGAIIIVDVTKKNAFLNIKKWKDKVLNIRCQNIPVQVIGNKIDMCDVYRDKNVEYVSCKSGKNVKESFQKFIETVESHPINISVTVWTWVYSWIPQIKNFPYRLEEFWQIVIDRIPLHTSIEDDHE